MVDKKDPSVTATATQEQAEPATPFSPVVVDIGKKKRRQIKRLRRGRGKLVGQIHSLIDELRADGEIAESAQPVIVIVRPKRRRRAGWF